MESMNIQEIREIWNNKKTKKSEASHSLIIKTPVSKISEDDQALMIVLSNFFLGSSSFRVIRSMIYINNFLVLCVHSVYYSRVLYSTL